MKRTMLFSMPILALALITFSCEKKEDDNPEVTTPVDTTISDAEAEGLKFMREEEKLARDVYLFSENLYGTQIFMNIGNSEQKHMDAVLQLLNKYGLEDPASDKVGVFNNAELQDLYDALIEKSEKSLLDAFVVGATIEDVDIYDLDNYMLATTKEDLLETYEYLNCGSRNHMRAFNKQVEKEGDTYIPQYITQERFDAIIAGDHEMCGEGNGHMRRGR